MRRAVGPITLAVLATVVVALLVPDRRVVGEAVAAYLGCLAACVAWWLLSTGPDRTDSEPLRAALTRTAISSATRGPDELLQLARLISFAHGSAMDAQSRLRPCLRQLACSLLLARRGLEVDPETGDVAGCLAISGEPLLERRPARLPAIGEPGPSLAEISTVVQRLEAI